VTLLLQQYRPTPEEDELLRADVRRMWSASTQTAHPGSSNVTKAALATRRVAFHKAGAGVDGPQAAQYGHDRWSVLINESAAWMVAKALGQRWASMVPPTMIRSLWPAPPLVHGFGVFSVGKPGETSRVEPLNDATVCDAAAFFDALIGQQDRHQTNYRWDQASGSLGLIDNAYAFAAPGSSSATGGVFLPHASLFVERRNQDGRKPLSQAEVGALGTLLGNQPLLDNLSRILRPEQFAALKVRAERMQTSAELLDVLEF